LRYASISLAAALPDVIAVPKFMIGFYESRVRTASSPPASSSFCTVLLYKLREDKRGVIIVSPYS